jgi:hypothetical protein
MLRHDLRRRPLALVGLALILLLGGGATLGSLVLAHRTDRAYPEYVAEAEVSDLVVNPSLSTRSMGRALRELPEVAEAHRSSLLFAGVAPPGFFDRPVTVAEVNESDPWTQGIGSPDGRFTEVDRPVVTEGRLPSGTREVFLADGYRRLLERRLDRRIRVGATLPFAFFAQAAVDPALGADPESVVEPIRTERLRVSGFGRLPDDVLAESLFPNQRFIVSGDVARRYTCLTDLRADQSRDEALDAMFPRSCSRAYDYYALRLRHGTGGAGVVRTGFARAATRLADDIPPGIEDQAGYYYVPQNRADVDAAVRRTTRPTVITLLAFSAIAALAAITVFALTLARLLARDESIRTSLRALGAPRGARVRLAVAAPLLAALAGLLGAVVVALLVSTIGPIGSVRSVVPHPGISAPTAVLVPATALLGVVLLLIVVGLAWSVAGTPTSSGAKGRPSRGLVGSITSLQRTGRPAQTEGVRAALSMRGGSGGVAAVGCAVALVVVVGASLFDANLRAVSNQPVRFGWPWDVAVISGAGYGSANVPVAQDTLGRRPEVVEYGLYALDASVRLDGRPVAATIGFRGSPPPELPIVSGRMATGPDEAVLGATTSDDLDRSVGDAVRVTSDLVELGRGRRVEIVGTAVMPPVGAFGSARAGLGLGAYINVDVPPTESAALATIRLRPGTDARAFLATIPFQELRWDTDGAAPVTHTSAVRPPEIATVDSLRAAPALLGVALGIALLVGLTLVSALSVHDRRRELAILRTLGFSDRMLRATVGWQSLATVTVGVVIGVPLGVLVGRITWRTFASELGLVPRADVPVVLVAAIAVGIGVLTIVAAAVPARAATKIRAEGLRVE